MYLNISRIGASILDREPLLISPSTNAVPPRMLKLEFRGEIIIGATIEYPKGITQEMVRKTLNSQFLPYEKKFSTSAVHAWRDEKDGVTMVLGTDDGIASLVMRSIDQDVLNGRKRAK